MKQVWRNVVYATYPPGPYRTDATKAFSRTLKRVPVTVTLECGHQKEILRRVGPKRADWSTMKALPDSWVVEAPPQRVRCKECETK